MKRVGIGIIGCGARTTGKWCGVIRHLPGRGKSVDIVAVCDPSPAAIRRARDSLCPDARVYRDYRDLVADPAVDWVAIGSWNCFHREHAVAAAKAGKHIFCEKPLATSLADCLAIRRAVDAAGVVFSLGFTMRYSPHYRRIKKMIDDGRIGDIVSFEFNETLEFRHGGYIMADWRRLTANAGSHLLEKCCHDIDLAHWLTGSLPARVASFGGTNFFIPRNRRHVDRIGADADGRLAYMPPPSWPKTAAVNPFTSRKDILDNQVVAIEYANGVHATFHTNCNSGLPERRLYICGTEGAIRADVVGGFIEVGRIGFNERVHRISTKAEGNHYGADAALCRELQRSMLRGAPPKADLEDGLRAAATCLGIDRAVATGRTVSMAPLWRRAGVDPARPAL